MFEYDSAFMNADQIPARTLDSYDPENKTSDPIETATDDKLRSWLLKKGHTEAGITASVDLGLTLKDLVRDEESWGTAYPY